MKLNYSYTEENYIKSIFSICHRKKVGKVASTGELAGIMKTKASSVTDMLRRLSDKKLVTYKKYYGASLTIKGEKLAMSIVRKHRIWEVFLVEKLNFKWDEVHEVAEQLEHVISEKLINKLDEFLDYPKKDPHGDPIPDQNGKMENIPKSLISSLNIGDFGIIRSFKNDENRLLRYLDKLGLKLGDSIGVIDKIEFDQSILISIDNRKLSISKLASENIYVT